MTGQRKTRERDGTHSKGKSGKRSRQCPSFLEGRRADGVADSRGKAELGRGFGTHWMRQLVKQAVKPQGQGFGSRTGSWDSQPVRLHGKG